MSPPAKEAGRSGGGSNVMRVVVRNAVAGICVTAADDAIGARTAHTRTAPSAARDIAFIRNDECALAASRDFATIPAKPRRRRASPPAIAPAIPVSTAPSIRCIARSRAPDATGPATG